MNQFTGGWTDVRIQTLKALWAEGLSGSQIAAEFGKNGIAVTRNGVIGKVHRLRLEKRQKPYQPRKADETRSRPRKPRNPRQYEYRAPFRFTHEPVEAVDLTPEEPVNPVILQDLQPHHCRWPVGPVSHEMLHCGADAAGAGPYCAFHTRIAYQPPHRRERNPWWLRFDPARRAVAI